jgi:hypothetical protein
MASEPPGSLPPVPPAPLPFGKDAVPAAGTPIPPLPGRLRGSWAAFRRLPTWAQVVIGVIVVFVLIGVILQIVFR